MIRIHRGAEPEALRDERYVRRAQAEIAFHKGETISFTGYTLARQRLYEAQNYKCAYCEMQALEPGLPVEHFRPKKGAIRESGFVDEGRYFWLAWTWENLWFSCGSCNCPARKGNHFPLADDSKALPIGAAPPGDEDALLIDPSLCDPVDHIRFIELLPGQWRPVARNGSRHGDTTIRRLGLDEPPITNFYDDHVERLVQPAIGRIRAAIDADDPAAIQATWRQELSTVFARLSPFHALSYDVLHASFQEEERARRSLVLPRPGNFATPVPSQERCNPAHAGLPAELARRARALGDRASPADLRSLLVDLCNHGPRSLAELSAILERAESTLHDPIQGLRANGSLSLTGDRYAPGRTPTS